MNERLASGRGLSDSWLQWEAHFKLAKCCMRASITMSDLGVFLAEPVLARYQTLNGGGVPLSS